MIMPSDHMTLLSRGSKINQVAELGKFRVGDLGSENQINIPQVEKQLLIQVDDMESVQCLVWQVVPTKRMVQLFRWQKCEGVRLSMLRNTQVFWTVCCCQACSSIATTVGDLSI